MNKMREKMTVIFAGLAGAFLLMIVFEWGAQGDMFRSGPRGDEIGSVNGLPITNKEYQDLFQGVRQQKLAETKKQTLTEEEESEVSQKAWDEMLTSKLIEQKLSEYGITITNQEVRERMDYFPPEELKRNFMDSSGRFHQQEYWQALRDPKNDTILTPLFSRMRENMKREKLQNILLSTIRLTNAEMWERFDIQNAKAVFDVVKVRPPQTAFNNFLSKVTDDEVKSYYESHKWQYKQDEGRKIKFVVFRELPTAKDSATVFDRAQMLAKRWKAMPLTESDSTLDEFAHDFSDAGFSHTQPIDKKLLSSLINSDSLMNAKDGDVIVSPSIQGPYRVVRLISSLDTGEELLHIKHIVFGGRGFQTGNRDSMKAVAEKVVAELKSGANFSEMARQYSSDPTARFGGEIGWLPATVLPPEAASAIAGSSLGEIVGPILSPMGYEVFVVKARSHKALYVQSIGLDVKASSQTARMSQQQANIFAEQAKKKGFDQAAKDMDLHVITEAPVITKKSQPMFGYPPFVSYMFALSPGDISTSVHIANIHVTVVAQVTDVIAKGTRPLDDELKRSLKDEIARSKMVESVAARAQQLRSMLQPGDDLAKLTAVDSTLKVERVTSGPAESTPQIGTEYGLLNLIFSMKPGDLTPAFKGDVAYYIAKVVEIRPTDKNTFNKQKPQFFMNLAQEKEQRFFNDWLQQMKDNAKVKDYRIARY